MEGHLKKLAERHIETKVLKVRIKLCMKQHFTLAHSLSTSGMINTHSWLMTGLTVKSSGGLCNCH